MEPPRQDRRQETKKAAAEKERGCKGLFDRRVNSGAVRSPVILDSARRGAILRSLHSGEQSKPGRFKTA
jgi:hypothetical protein